MQWGLASEIAAAYAMATASAKGGTSDAERVKTTKQSERIKKDGLRGCALLRDDDAGPLMGWALPGNIPRR